MRVSVRKRGNATAEGAQSHRLTVLLKLFDRRILPQNTDLSQIQSKHCSSISKLSTTVKPADLSSFKIASMYLNVVFSVWGPRFKHIRRGERPCNRLELSPEFTMLVFRNLEIFSTLYLRLFPTVGTQIIRTRGAFPLHSVLFLR